VETSFVAPGISCAGCDRTIKQALGGVPGVSGVSVDVAAKTVNITHDGSVGPEALAEILSGASTPGQTTSEVHDPGSTCHR
jgi:copper chaperone CopZ